MHDSRVWGLTNHMIDSCMGVVCYQWRIQKSLVGDVVEPSGRRPRDERGGIWGGGIPSQRGKDLGRGCDPSQNFFSILDLKMASFGALWVPVGMHPHPPSGSATVCDGGWLTLIWAWSVHDSRFCRTSSVIVLTHGVSTSLCVIPQTTVSYAMYLKGKRRTRCLPSCRSETAQLLDILYFIYVLLHKNLPQPMAIFGQCHAEIVAYAFRLTLRDLKWPLTDNYFCQWLSLLTIIRSSIYFIFCLRHTSNVVLYVWLGGLLVERRTCVSQIRGSIPRQVAAV